MSYQPDDLGDDWEFKIVRSNLGAFHNPDVLRRVVEEEEVAGWRLLEKFDDNRLRFKRPASARQRDAMLPEGVDPYRTQYGRSDAFLGLAIVGAVIAAIVLAVLVAAAVQGTTP